MANLNTQTRHYPLGTPIKPYPKEVKWTGNSWKLDDLEGQMYRVLFAELDNGMIKVEMFWGYNTEWCEAFSKADARKIYAYYKEAGWKE